MRTLTRRLGIALLLLTCLAAPLPAQGLRGRVLDRESGAPVANAAIELRTPAGEVVAGAVADTLGSFQVSAPSAGTFVLRAERIGYASLETRSFVLEPRETLEVEVRLGSHAIPLEPLVVTGRVRVDHQIAAFYDRVEGQRRLGSGRFLTRADLDREASASLPAVLQRIPEVRVIDVLDHPTAVPRMELRMVVRGQQCRPRLYLDGMALQVDGLDPRTLHPPRDLEGVEVYRTPFEAPAEYQDPNGCGTLLLWTRVDAGAGRRSHWLRNAVGSATLLAFVLHLVLR